MAREPVERSYFVAETDPETPVHSHVVLPGHLQITAERAQELWAAKRMRAVAVPSRDVERVPAGNELGPLLQRIAQLESRPVTVSVPVQGDAPDYEPYITALQNSVMGQEKAMQNLVTILDDLHRRVVALEDVLRALTDNAAETLSRQANAA